MKRLIFIVVTLLLITTVMAQNELAFEKVIQAESLTKDELFVIVNDWVATTFVSANDVIQMVDKDAGLIICKGLFLYSHGKYAYKCFEGNVRYMIKVAFKDERFKVEVSNFIHSNEPTYARSCNLGLITTDEVYATSGMNKNYQNNVWDDIKDKAEMKSNEMFSELETRVKSSINSTDNDW